MFEEQASLYNSTMPKEGGVYAFFVDKELHYVGSAQTGLARRLKTYEKTAKLRTAARIRELVKEAIREGHKVEMFAIVPTGPIEYSGLPLNLIAGLEEGLIRELQPPWNRRGRGRLKKLPVPIPT